MKRSQRYRAAVALALAATPVATAQAQGPAPTEGETTRFEFRSPAGCSSAEEFTARVRRRSWRIRLETTAPAGARALVIEIQPPAAGGALRGIVTVVEPDGSTRTRRLKAATCDEAVDALSLIATVTLDPEAMLGEPEPEREPEPKLPAEPKPAAPSPKPPAAPPPSRVKLGAPDAAGIRISFGLAGTVLWRVAPEPAWGGSAFAALEVLRSSVFSPEFRLGVTHAQRRSLREPGGKASFAFTLPSLDVCPLRVGPRRVGLRPCGFVEAGWLKVWGDASGRDESHLRFHGQGGAALLAELQVSKSFEILADGRVSFPFARDSYGFNGVPFFTTPTPGFSASLGAAGGFP